MLWYIIIEKFKIRLVADLVLVHDYNCLFIALLVYTGDRKVVLSHSLLKVNTPDTIAISTISATCLLGRDFINLARYMYNEYDISPAITDSLY
jgi:hypothetical protein